MLKIAICDDEEIILKKIEKSLKIELENLKIKYELKSFVKGETLLKYQNIDDFDILFLDIELKTINGIDIAHILRNNGYENTIVFVTSFADYSIIAYKVNAFRFILKDKLETELSECIKNLVVKLGLKKISFDDVMIDIKDIVYIESIKHQVIIHFINGDEYRVYDTLDNVEKKINSSNLIRIRKSYLVNIIYIKNIKCYTVTILDKDNSEFEINIPKDKYGKIKNKICMKKSLWR